MKSVLHIGCLEFDYMRISQVATSELILVEYKHKVWSILDIDYLALSN